MKVIIYIDGFNLYHSLTSDSHKWLDLKKLSSCFVSPKDEIIAIKYFSALSWNHEKRKRHENLIKVYTDSGITTILGKFKEIQVICPKKIKGCSGKYITHAEKQTDVNIATQIVQDACQNKMDKAYIISRDSDLIPAIKILNSLGKYSKIIFPINKAFVEELKTTANQHQVLKTEDFEKSILPNPYITKTGEKIFCPPEWQ
jgi:uncharacterized LabA/DUF88 family protein